MNKDLDFKLERPGRPLDGFVESFWVLKNLSGDDKEIVIIPDGRFDLILMQSAATPFHITLSGLETFPSQATLPAKTCMFAVSFKLPAAEYVFHQPVSSLLNYAAHLPAGFWNFRKKDMNNFGSFCKKAAEKIRSSLPGEMDHRKQMLFDLIYSSKGELSVKELSAKVYWSSRQINRYFNQQFGISLKAYCSILRFRSSLEHMAEGRLFPELNFADQSHFIKEVKKFSGVAPKELLKNKNGRFIQFSAIASK